MISLFKYGYNRSKTFRLYKNCKWIIKTRRGGQPFESTSVEMNKNNMLSSIKIREKSVYLLDGDNELREVERDQQIEAGELFNEVQPGYLLRQLNRHQFMVLRLGYIFLVLTILL